MTHCFLIVYELIPENCKVFAVSTEDSALAERIRSCHRQFVNSTETPDDLAEFISNLDTFATLVYSDESDEDIKEFKDPVKLMGVAPNTELIHTGFIL